MPIGLADAPRCSRAHDPRVTGRLVSLFDQWPVRFAFYLMLLVALRFDCLDDPFFSDGLSYVMPTVFRQVDSSIMLYPGTDPSAPRGTGGGGHPFLFFTLLAGLIKAGLPPVLTSHAVNLLFSALVLVGVDRLSFLLAGRHAGTAAAAPCW